MTPIAKQHSIIYDVEELAERSADFERLITNLINLTNIPKGMRTISTNRIKINHLTAEIYDIVRLNKNVNQNNINQLNLFDL